MAKHSKMPAAALVYVMGLMPPSKTPDGRDIAYGRKAVTGQYTKKYTRTGHLTHGRVSKGCQKRYDRDRGVEGRLDLAEYINARR